MASPGAGKTSLIEQTLPRLAEKLRVAVADGDIATSIDADRAAAAGAAVAVQVNTGGECHLDAVMLHQALGQINLDKGRYAARSRTSATLSVRSIFALERISPCGSPRSRKATTSLTNLPACIAACDALVINKIDLLPYIDFKMDYFQRGVQNPQSGPGHFPLFLPHRRRPG